MSYITLAQSGLAAVDEREWATAVANLSKALQTSTNPAWLIGRSKAYVNLNRYSEALDDANLAWHTAYDRNNRALMVQANYRRAVAYFRLGKLADADACCVYTMRLIKGGPAVDKEGLAGHLRDAETGRWIATAEDAVHEAQDEASKSMDGSGRGGGALAMAMNADKSRKDSQEWRLASTLRIRILTAMEKLSTDDPARVVTVTARPEKKAFVDNIGYTEKKDKDVETIGTTDSDEEMDDGNPQPATCKRADSVPTQSLEKSTITREESLRLQEFQTNTAMSVSIFSKGVKKDMLVVKFEPRSVHLDKVIYPNGDEKEFKLDLWGEIDTKASKYSVTPNKVELVLTKKTPGKWARLQPDGNETADSAVASSSTKTASAAEAKPPSTSVATGKTKTDTAERAQTGPVYPSSSRTGPKNWDKLEADEEEEDKEDVNLFFKKLFKNATPEQQRAMKKSFTESNGTTLSTDWNNVKDKKVETKPPKGVEAKNWE